MSKMTKPTLGAEGEGNLLSNCCASDFDAWGFAREDGIWQERCLECGKLCEPLLMSNKDIENIKRCVSWNKDRL